MSTIREHRVGMRRALLAVFAAAVVFLGLAAGSASGQQRGLVNVDVSNNTVQVPVAVAANICGVQANIIATNTFGGNAVCTSTSRANAQDGGGGGGGANQQGLVNVALTGNTVQVPIGVAANVCGVQANIIAAGTFGGNALCTAISRPEATA
jgi:ChpA-C